MTYPKATPLIVGAVSRAKVRHLANYPMFRANAERLRGPDPKFRTMCGREGRARDDKSGLPVCGQCDKWAESARLTDLERSAQ